MLAFEWLTNIVQKYHFVPELCCMSIPMLDLRISLSVFTA
jgi:hypothetical protein